MSEQDELPPVDPTDEPIAQTATDEDHENVDQFRGGEAAPPRDPDEPFDDIPDDEEEGS